MRSSLVVCLLLCLLVAPAPLPPPALPPLESTDDLLAQSVSDDGSPLPDEETMRDLAKNHPIAFLENCLRRYGREVKGYSALLSKHERLEGQLGPPEVLQVAFREHPYSVRLRWLEGTRRAGTVLYVKGENRDHLLIRPAGRLLSLVGIVERDPYGEDARQNGRYRLPEFGIRHGTERTLACWRAASKRQTLHVQYLGTKPVPQLGNRTCHVLHRTDYDYPEDDGIADLLLYVDVQNWLQIGTVLRDAKGDLIAEYYFRDLHLNPTFPPDQFTRQGMIRNEE